MDDRYGIIGGKFDREQHLFIFLGYWCSRFLIGRLIYKSKKLEHNLLANCQSLPEEKVVECCSTQRRVSRKVLVNRGKWTFGLMSQLA